MMTLDETLSKTETLSTIDLIREDLNPAEASEIVSTQLVPLIDFHKLRNYRQHIRFGSGDREEIQKINDLKNALELANEQIAEAKRSGKMLRISSTLSIELI